GGGARLASERRTQLPTDATPSRPWPEWQAGKARVPGPSGLAFRSCRPKRELPLHPQPPRCLANRVATEPSSREKTVAAAQTSSAAENSRSHKSGRRPQSRSAEEWKREFAGTEPQPTIWHRHHAAPSSGGSCGEGLC